jgi:CelD/BcsL family acetyltransferase involved in cellulose biosynthesis
MSPGAEPASRISNSFRRRLRSKEKKFHALPGYRYFRAATAADVSRLLDWFFRIKPQRMAEQKLPNVFDDPGVEAFIRTACLTPRIGGFAIDIHALECNEEIIAVYAGVADGRRFSMMFNTYTTSENARYSPGLILMRNIIDFYGEAGYRELDLGVGADDYKRLFCKSDEKSFDSFLPLTSRGRLGAIAMASVYHGKRLVKQNQTLHDVARLLRGAFG